MQFMIKNIVNEIIRIYCRFHECFYKINSWLHTFLTERKIGVKNITIQYIHIKIHFELYETRHETIFWIQYFFWQLHFQQIVLNTLYILEKWCLHQRQIKIINSKKNIDRWKFLFFETNARSYMIQIRLFQKQTL